MEQRKPSRGEGGEEEELDDSRTSMPALARPCAPLMLKLASMQVVHWYCGCTTPNQSPVMQCLLRKSRPLKFEYGALGPTSLTYGAVSYV